VYKKYTEENNLYCSRCHNLPSQTSLLFFSPPFAALPNNTDVTEGSSSYWQRFPKGRFIDISAANNVLDRWNKTISGVAVIGALVICFV
jgi:hypothetical protein